MDRSIRFEFFNPLQLSARIDGDVDDVANILGVDVRFVMPSVSFPLTKMSTLSGGSLKSF